MFKLSELRKKLVDENQFRDFEEIIDEEVREFIISQVYALTVFYTDTYRIMTENDYLEKIRLICLNLVMEYVILSELDCYEQIGLLIDNTVHNVIQLLIVDFWSS